MSKFNAMNSLIIISFRHTIKRSRGMQSKSLDKSIKHLPLQNNYLGLPSILLINELKHVLCCIYVDSKKGVKYLFIAASISFLVSLSYSFESIIKVLAGLKFDISFFLEVPLLIG